MKLTGRWFAQIVDRDSGNLYPIYINYSTKETHIWLPLHIISIFGIATHIIWYQAVPRSIWNRMKATIIVSCNYPRYQSRTSTAGVSCQKWQFLYFYGHHQKQFVCTFWWRNHGLGRNNSTWQDGSGDRWRQLKCPSLYRRDIATSGCSLSLEHGARGIVPGWQRPTPSSQDRGRVPAAGTNHEGGLAGFLTGLRPYWACLGSVGKSSPDAPERGQHTCWPPEVSVGGVG